MVEVDFTLSFGIPVYIQIVMQLPHRTENSFKAPSPSPALDPNLQNNTRRISIEVPQRHNSQIDFTMVLISNIFH